MLSLLTLLQLLVASCYVFTEDAQLPSYIKPCRYDSNEAEFEECVKQQLVKALPRFTRGEPAAGAPALDPVRLQDVAVDAGGLRVALRNATMHGLGSADVHDLRVNLKEEKFTLKFVANMSVRGAYSVSGRILLLPILGDGDCTITAHNTEVEISSKLSIVKSRLGEHLKLVGPSYRYQIQRTTVQFQNLFNGNKELSDVMHRFANENWQQLMEELAPPVVRQIVRTCVRAINQFFDGVPIQRLVVCYTPRRRR